MEIRRDTLEAALTGKLDGQAVSGPNRGVKVYAGGRFVGKVSVSQSWRKLDKERLRMVAGQLFLSVHDLHDIVRCEKDATWYVAHLLRTGRL